MTNGGRRVLGTLRDLARFFVSRRIVDDAEPGSAEDRIHVGRVFALMADPEIRGCLAVALAALGDDGEGDANA